MKFKELLVNKRCDIVSMLSRGENVDEIMAECDVIEAELDTKDDPTDLMYSVNKEEIISYRQKVLEIEAEKDDYLFSLAGSKGETIETLSKKTLSEIISFAERLTRDGRY